MALFLVLTEADVAARVPKHNVCRLRADAYFVRAGPDESATSLTKKLNLSEEVYGTVVMVGGLAGWEELTVTNLINEWMENDPEYEKRPADPDEEELPAHVASDDAPRQKSADPK